MDSEFGQPNIVLIVADDLGYGELGCQGNTEIPTPHIDALAESGVRFTQAYVTAPNCSPSRAGLLAGRFPTRFGYEFNPIGARNEDPGTGMPISERLLPELLHAAGYTTGLIGKWHLGGAADYHPQRHGFDYFFGFAHEGHYFEPFPWANTTTMLRKRVLPAAGGAGTRHSVTENLIYSSHMGHDEPDYDANNPIVRNGQPVLETEYLTDALAREGRGFIEKYQSTPFFLALTFNAVHSPLQAKSSTVAELSHIEDVQRRIFAAMLVDLDRAVGRVLAKLEECALDDNTIVVFLSDNGGPTKELTSSNGLLREGKGSMYEGGLRVPMLVKWPGVAEPHTVCDEVVSSLDLLPTLCEAAGAEVPSDLDGVDMRPIFEGQENTMGRILYWRQGGRAALRKGGFKIVAPQRKADNRSWELYNIESDIGESRDLSKQLPEVLEDLVREWGRMDQQMLAPAFR